MLATMTDRTLPLAERVTAAVRSGMNAQAGDERFLPLLDALDGLLADIAAADRLARAAEDASAAWERYVRAPAANGADRGKLAVHKERNADYLKALDAYRARMAQGVARGE